MAKKLDHINIGTLITLTLMWGSIFLLCILHKIFYQWQ
jgi:hypothetical protein